MQSFNKNHRNQPESIGICFVQNLHFPILANDPAIKHYQPC